MDTNNPLLKDPTQEIETQYFKEISERLSYHKELNSQSTLKIVFTPMHGVGKEWVAKAFQAFHIPPYIAVPKQIEPHPDFPTVPFPNPEEGKGALVQYLIEKLKRRLTFLKNQKPFYRN